MESMKEVRNWLANKCKFQPPFAQTPREQQNYGSVVTPQNIPQFIIPKSSSDGSSRDSGEKLSIDDDDNSRNSISPPDSRNASPRNSPRGSFLGLEYNDIRCSRSAPTSPYKQVPMFHSVDLYSCEDLITLKAKDTNADPQSIAAMSLPHFRTKTAFGFTTLNQAPHTRRKESLFHCESENIPAMLTRRQSKRKSSENNVDLARSSEISLSLSPTVTTTGNHEDDFPLCRRGSRRRETPSTVVTPVTILTGQKRSPDSSPVPSPVSPGCPMLVQPTNGATLSPYYLSPDMANLSRKSRRNRLYYRRRSSLPGFEEELSSTDGSSSDTSSVGRRKSNGSLQKPVDVTLQKRHSSPCAAGEKETLSGCPVPNLRLSCSSSDTTTAKFQSQMLAEFGEVKLSFRYLPDIKQFKVVLIKAENLGGRNKADQNINSYAKIYLMPGKVQRHTSETIKRTRDPIYNQEFYFNEITTDELKAMKLRIKIFHKGHNFGRHVFLGEIVVPLEKYNIQNEQRMWKDLEPKMDSEELGYLQTSLAFDPRSGRLEVRILQAKDLPKHHLTGAPDPYVKVVVSVPGKVLLKKQTRIRKKTTQPMFKESFSFEISPKLQDINYTAVTLTIYDHDRIRSDDVIGQVRLGYGATEETEFDQWNEAMQNPSQEITKWHYLMETDEDG